MITLPHVQGAQATIEALHQTRRTTDELPRTMGELRDKTQQKMGMPRSKGHMVLEKWDFRKEVKEDEELKVFFKSY